MIKFYAEAEATIKNGEKKTNEIVGLKDYIICERENVFSYFLIIVLIVLKIDRQ